VLSTIPPLLVLDPYRGEQRRHGARGQHRVDQWPPVEPAGGGPFDARRHALEPHRQVLDGPGGQVAAEQPAQRCIGVQMAVLYHGCELTRRTAFEDVGDPQRGPQVGQLRHRGHRRVRRHRRAVDRTDGGADHQVRPDPGVEQRGEHPHLAGPEDAAAAEHERHRPVRRAQPPSLRRGRAVPRRRG
jgi:hypothetical protein